MAIVIHARPNLNGNTPEDFREIAHKLYREVGVMNEILQNVSGIIMHGRNYQTYGSDGFRKRQNDLELLSALTCQVDYLRRLAEGISEASDE